MGFYNFKCEEDSERYCCDCNNKNSCDKARCSMNCLNETEEEKEISNLYYKNYVKPIRN